MVTVTDEEGKEIPGESFDFREITEQDQRYFGMLDENAGNCLALLEKILRLPLWHGTKTERKDYIPMYRT